jgi:hypothetical protein
MDACDASVTPKVVRVRAKDVLDQVRFGQGIAESDRHLERYFVRTPAFSEIVRDEAHLILGVKGSGKTAIARVLGSGMLNIPELKDVRTIPASVAQNTALFTNIPIQPDESQMQKVWLAYCLSLAAHQLLESGAPDDVTQPVADLLTAADLAPSTETAPEETMQRLVQSLGGLSGAAESQTHRPLAVLDPPRFRWLRPDYNFKPLAEQLQRSFETVDTRCWILLDRLDETFAAEPQLEMAALRGLLRAHLELVHYGDRVRCKIFLRSDIFDHVTQTEGFRNLDHFDAVHLTWRRSDVLGLIAERIRVSSSFTEMNAPTSLDEIVVHRCVPATVSYFTGHRHLETNAVDWCLETTAARKDEPSPRNILRLLREAQRLALTRLDAVTAEYDFTRPLIRDNELIDALDVLSETRLIGTIYAENNHLRPFVEAFQHQTRRATRQTLTARLFEVDSSCDVKRVLWDLQSIGFLYLITPGVFDVAPLYLPALDIERSNANRTDEHRVVRAGISESPERVRDAAKELSSQGEHKVATELLIRGFSIPMENAILAANIAVESRSLEMMSVVETLLERDDFAESLIGKRVALNYALGRPDRARELSNSINTAESLDVAIGQFIGSLTFDSRLESGVWRQLLRARDWESQNASAWDKIVPIAASSRVLAVARGMKGAESFAAAAKGVFLDWYGEPERVPAADLMRFLSTYARDRAHAPVGMFPYQVVSIAYVLGMAGSLSNELSEELVTSLAAHVQSSPQRHQRTFRDWAELDALARAVVAQIGATQ